MKKILFTILFGALIVLIPSVGHAQVATTTPPSRVMIEQELLSLLEELLTYYQNLSTSTPVSTPTVTSDVQTAPTFGSIQSPNLMPTTPTVTTIVGGLESTCNQIAIDQTLGQCNNADVLDKGIVYFDVEGDFKSAMLSYWPTETPSAITRNGNLIKANQTVPIYTFQSATSYTWKIDFTDANGNVTTQTGTFDIPTYTYAQNAE